MSLDSGGGTPVPQRFARICHVCNARTRARTFCDSCGHPLCPSCTCEVPEGSVNAHRAFMAANQAATIPPGVDHRTRPAEGPRRTSLVANADAAQARKNQGAHSIADEDFPTPRPLRAVPPAARKGTVTGNPFVVADRAAQTSVTDGEAPDKSTPASKSNLSECLPRREDFTVDSPWQDECETPTHAGHRPFRVASATARIERLTTYIQIVMGARSPQMSQRRAAVRSRSQANDLRCKWHQRHLLKVADRGIQPWPDRHPRLKRPRNLSAGGRCTLSPPRPGNPPAAAPGLDETRTTARTTSALGAARAPRQRIPRAHPRRRNPPVPPRSRVVYGDACSTSRRRATRSSARRTTPSTIRRLGSWPGRAPGCGTRPSHSAVSTAPASLRSISAGRPSARRPGAGVRSNGPPSTRPARPRARGRASRAPRPCRRRRGKARRASRRCPLTPPSARRAGRLIRASCRRP